MIQAVPAIGTPATLPLHMLRADTQIRTRNGFDEASLSGLATTIKEHGLIQPIVVRPGDDGEYIVIAGERRMLACSMAGLSEVPVLIRESDSGDTMAVQAIENIQRQQLTLADTADGVAQLVAHYGSAKAAALVLGMSPAWISKHVSLTKAHPDVRTVLFSGLTEDLELVGTLNQIRKLPNGAGVDTFKRLASGLEQGTVTRADARAALDKLKAPTLPAQKTSEGDEEEGEGNASTKQNTVFLHLNDTLAAKLEALGGTDWLIAQITNADAEE